MKKREPSYLTYPASEAKISLLANVSSEINVSWEETSGPSGRISRRQEVALIGGIDVVLPCYLL